MSLGLNHMNGRVQDAITGRFLSPDPHTSRPGNTQSYNRYSYVANNPLTFVDPSGFDIETVTTTASRDTGGSFSGSQPGLGYAAASGNQNGHLPVWLEQSIEEVQVWAARINDVAAFFSANAAPVLAGKEGVEETHPDSGNPCPGDAAQALADTGEALLKGWERAFEAASLLDKVPNANAHANVAKGFGALNAGINLQRMQSAYQRNDLTVAISAAADFTIDVGVNLIPGWGGIVVGGACDLGGCGDAIGRSVGPIAQFTADFRFPGSLLNLHYNSLPKETHSNGCTR